jgi:hypothetical protein
LRRRPTENADSTRLSTPHRFSDGFKTVKTVKTVMRPMTSAAAVARHTAEVFAHPRTAEFRQFVSSEL